MRPLLAVTFLGLLGASGCFGAPAASPSAAGVNHGLWSVGDYWSYQRSDGRTARTDTVISAEPHGGRDAYKLQSSCFGRCGNAVAWVDQASLGIFEIDVGNVTARLDAPHPQILPLADRHYELNLTGIQSGRLHFRVDVTLGATQAVHVPAGDFPATWVNATWKEDHAPSSTVSEAGWYAPAVRNWVAYRDSGGWWNLTAYGRPGA